MDVLKHLNCSPAQLMPNCWQCLKFLEADASWLKLDLSIKLFLYWFSVKPKDGGRVMIQQKGKHLEGFPASIRN